MSMFKVYRKEIDWEGRKLILETGKVARQADGAVLVTYGDTTVLCAATGAKQQGDQDFFPLTIHYLEKTYAAGKIPGGFFKREAKPSEHETLTSRLIDRPIRPLFPDGFKNEVQVICTVLSHDMENSPDIAALVGASAALTLSGMPFMGPIGAARVGLIDGKTVINPTPTELEQSNLDLVVAGTKEGVLMVESEASELDEDTMLKAVMAGHKSFQPVIDAIIEMAQNCAKEPWELPEKDEKLTKSVNKEIADLSEKDFRKAYGETDKQTRSNMLNEIRTKVKEAFAEREDVPSAMVSDLVKKLESEIVRQDLLKTKKRIDGRGTEDIRNIVAEAGFLPLAHGSALFTRGETQAMCVATLGTGQDEQIIDALEGEYKENFLLHYNFPPYSVGEAGRMGPPGRREIGHGKLAWRALKPLMPSKEDFPYTIRVVSEITESNGSSSMATVCGTSLAMMDAGVPLPKSVAGIAMGLVKEGKDFVVLSDIMGDEDHLGDMDFKVAGTHEGITALQMDIKITSITEAIMKQALKQAQKGRRHILKEMTQALDHAREGVSENAPQMISLNIPTDKIRDVIGTGGKVIREICETTGSTVDIDDDGTVRVAAVNRDAAQQAVDWIKGITTDPEVNDVYTGKVVNILDFGAFVDLPGGRTGLVHISEFANERIAKVTDVVQLDDEVKVMVIGYDPRGKLKLSYKAVDQETGEALEDATQRASKGGGDRKRKKEA